MTGSEHLRVEHRVEKGVAMNAGSVVVGELGGLLGQEVLVVPSMDCRPGKECGQDQDGAEVQRVDRARHIEPGGSDEGCADFVIRAPNEEERDENPEHDANVVRSCAYSRPSA